MEALRVVLPLISASLGVDVVGGIAALLDHHRVANDLRMQVFAAREARKAFFGEQCGGGGTMLGGGFTWRGTGKGDGW